MNEYPSSSGSAMSATITDGLYAIECRERVTGGRKCRNVGARIPQRLDEQFAAVGMILEEHDGIAP